MEAVSAHRKLYHLKCGHVRRGKTIHNNEPFVVPYEMRVYKPMEKVWCDECQDLVDVVASHPKSEVCELCQFSEPVVSNTTPAPEVRT